MTYSYTALEASGRKMRGMVDASTAEAAKELLASDGRYVLEITEEEPKARSAGTFSGGRVSRSDLALFTRRLADLSSAGLPLDRVIAVIAEQSESQVLSNVCAEALKEVRGGKPVSEALSRYPRLFSDIFVQTIKAGEASGQFPEVVARLADFQEKEVARRSQITSALIYPAILSFVAVAVVIFLLTFVVPRLSGVFAQIGNELPLSTRFLMSLTGLLTAKGLYLLGGLIVFGFAFRWWTKTENGAYIRDSFLLRAPVVGVIVKKATVSRYSRVLSTLVYGGVPILEALSLAGLAAGNRVFRKSSDHVEGEVRGGRSIAVAMRDAGNFPPVLTNMVSVGEETGNLPLMLNRVSDSLDFEVDNGMRRLTSMVEPLIVLVMGAIVGFVVISVLLPIYQAQDVIK